jgi:hypothetical protein
MLCCEEKRTARRGSQVVRQRSAKPLFGGSIPPRASKLIVQQFCNELIAAPATSTKFVNSTPLERSRRAADATRAR